MQTILINCFLISQQGYPDAKPERSIQCPAAICHRCHGRSHPGAQSQWAQDHRITGGRPWFFNTRGCTGGCLQSDAGWLDPLRSKPGIPWTAPRCRSQTDARQCGFVRPGKRVVGHARRNPRLLPCHAIDLESWRWGAYSRPELGDSCQHGGDAASEGNPYSCTAGERIYSLLWIVEKSSHP